MRNVFIRFDLRRGKIFLCVFLAFQTRYFSFVILFMRRFSPLLLIIFSTENKVFGFYL